MKTREQIYAFLKSLQWGRMSKKMLNTKLSAFLGHEMYMEEATDTENKDSDYSLIFTTTFNQVATNFIDIEVYYLKMRNREILITGAELLDYQI